MQVRAAHPAKIRIIRGGKKKTHSSAFVKFDIFVLKKLRDSCAPCYLDFYWGSPQPILTPNYTIPHIASVNPKKHLSKFVLSDKTCPSLLVLSEISIQQRGCAVIDCGTAPFLMGRFCFSVSQPVRRPHSHPFRGWRSSA